MGRDRSRQMGRERGDVDPRYTAHSLHQGRGDLLRLGRDLVELCWLNCWLVLLLSLLLLAAAAAAISASGALISLL